MNKTAIGLLFIFAGVAYGSLAIDGFYNKTLGFMYKNGLLKTPPDEKIPHSILGPKGQVILYAVILIIIGLYILWNRNN
jgi:hypothetical protein